MIIILTSTNVFIIITLTSTDIFIIAIFIVLSDVVFEADFFNNKQNK